MSTKRQKELKAEIEKLRKQAEEDDSVSVSEFKIFVDTVVDWLKTTKDDFKAELSAMKETISSSLKEAKEALSSSVDKKLSELDRRSDALTQKIEDRLSKVEDGKDADPKETAEIVLAQVLPKFSTKEELEEVKELLEDLSKIKKLVEQMANRPLNSFAPLPTGGLVGRDFIKEIDLSSQLDGSTKTFNIGAFYKILTVDLSSFPNALRKTIDYTYSGTDGTITFTSEIDAASSLATGQTCIITVVTA